MDAGRRQELNGLIQQWGIPLKRLDNLNQALTHPTYVFEKKKKGLVNNQRLEFLGDAVLGLVVGDHLFRRYPDRPEGELTKMRAALVCESSLGERAKALGLGRYLLLGRGEEMNGGRERVSVLADAFEAVMGAIYLDAGLETAADFIISQLARRIDDLNSGNYGDHKTMLQELVQSYGEESVSYQILQESGPDHQKTFVAGVTYREHFLARGSGNSKKEAEQNAAQAAIDDLDKWRLYLTGERS